MEIEEIRDYLRMYRAWCDDFIQDMDSFRSGKQIVAVRLASRALDEIDDCEWSKFVRKQGEVDE